MRRQSRTWMTVVVGVLVAAILAYAFRPLPVMVDMGVIARAPMKVTIDEEAKTRVRDVYVVSAPIDGRLLRVEVEGGDVVEGGETIIARMLPINPPALDLRTRAQDKAAASAAKAALQVRRAELNKAIADKDLAGLELKRARQLHKRGTVSQVGLDEAERTWRVMNAALDMAKASISIGEADLAKARARLIRFNGNPRPVARAPANADTIPLTAPVSGRILRVMQESQTTLVAGAPILEIGDISNDLEIVAELLSTDAVRITAGDRVIIVRWGGPYPLSGFVERVEPWGFTKFSALGVEEQRVNAIIKFTDPPDRRGSLGHGFRVEAKIVVWQSEDALIVPSSALFREGAGWAVYTVEVGRAHLRPVEVGHNNGAQAQILGGLDTGDKIILYPGPGVSDGIRVERRNITK